MGSVRIAGADDVKNVIMITLVIIITDFGFLYFKFGHTPTMMQGCSARVCERCFSNIDIQ